MPPTVGIVVHHAKPSALAFAREVIAWLASRGAAVRLDEESAELLGEPALVCHPGQWHAADFVVTLGGDGTILTAARLLAGCGVPILGVHMGRFGFIAETHPNDLFPHLEEILDGRMRVEERLMVGAEIVRGGKVVHNAIGLNDAVVRTGLSHMLLLKTHLGGALFATYPADGAIVATPTGSTGYALSAGGPLVAPTLAALILVPICPHTLSARPMVLPASEVIEMEIEADGGDAILSVDGADPFELNNRDRIVVRRSEHTTRLIVLDHATFYGKVRNRYLYGERLNH